MSGVSIIFAALAFFTACASVQDDLCENVGQCSQGGDSSWIQRCKDEAKALDKEAALNGCARQLDDYFNCALERFDCRGATSVVAGCDQERAAADACLDQGEGATACAALRNAESACASVQVSTSTPAAIVRPACTLARDCRARCFLDEVSNVCAATVDELDRFNACASSCPG